MRSRSEWLALAKERAETALGIINHETLDDMRLDEIESEFRAAAEHIADARRKPADPELNS